MKMNVAYLRVSTEAQTEKYGLDVQKQKILDFCEKNGIVIDRWYIDGGYSGSKLDRPEIQKLLDDAESGGIQRVFIYKLDRMSRDVIDTLTLLYRLLPKYGVEIVSMTEDLRFDNPMDKVMIGVNAIMGQYEREIIYMRTRAGMVERVKKGLWMGGGRIPWGYRYDRNDGILHIVPEQAEMVRQAYKMYIEGYSCDSISKLLGFKGERIVTEILKRKSNMGLIEYKGEVYKGLHEPIIDKDTFYRAQECMEKRHTNAHVSDNNILTGLCWCGVCGARMRYQKWGAYHKLVCYSQQTSKEYMKRDPNCDNVKPRADIIENEVEDYFFKFALQVEETQKAENRADLLEDAVKKANAKIKKLYNLYAENSSDNLLEVIQDEEKRLKDIKKELEAEKKKERVFDADRVDRIKQATDAGEILSNSEKNKVLKEAIEKVVITGDDVEIHFFTF